MKGYIYVSFRIVLESIVARVALLLVVYTVTVPAGGYVVINFIIFNYNFIYTGHCFFALPH